MKGCASICKFVRGVSNDGISYAVVSGWRVGGWAARLAAPVAEAQNHSPALRLVNVLREAHAEFDQASPSALPVAIRRARLAGTAAGTGVRSSLCTEAG